MNPETHAANRSAAWRWGAFIVSLLGLQVIGGIMAIVLASSDESVAVVPNYHQKALKWDEEVAQRSASRALGWTVDVSQVDEAASAAGLRIALSDRRGKPIDLLSGKLEIYRNARASDVHRVEVPPGSYGLLELSGCFDVGGRWQVMLDVTDRAGNRFTCSHELYVRAAGEKDSAQ
jgi:nitrogen fixation protein FixH